MLSNAQQSQQCSAMLSNGEISSFKNQTKRRIQQRKINSYDPTKRREKYLEEKKNGKRLYDSTKYDPSKRREKYLEQKRKEMVSLLSKI